MRRSLICCFVALLATPSHAQKRGIAVVTVPGIEAYEQTVQGLREQMPDVQVLDVRDVALVRDRLRGPGLALAIAVGSEAAAVIDQLAAAEVACMRVDLLQYDAEHSPPRRPGAVITVDIQPAILLAELKRLFPGKTHLGVIRGPLQTDRYMKAVELAAGQYGFTLEVVNCLEARQMVAAFLQLNGRVDFVWCPPNPELYNSATLRPLLIASLTNRLPIIGFSEQFAQAGALFTGAADFQDVGHLAAELAVRILKGETIGAQQEARKFNFVYNQRMARLLGIKAGGADHAGKELKVIQ